MFNVPQGEALKVVFKAFLASDHITAATGKTIAVTISKNGAAFGNPSGGATNATGIANGWYYVDLTTTDTNFVGPLAIHGTEGTIDPIGVLYNLMSASGGYIRVNAKLVDDVAPEDAVDIAAAVRTNLTTELARIDVATSTRASQTSVDDIPTNAELATSQASSDDATLAAIAALPTAASITTLSGKIDVIDDFLDTEVAAIKTKTDFLPSATAGAASGLAIVGSAMTLTTGERDSVATAHLDLANGVETGRTVRMAHRAAAAAAGGVVAGAGTATITISALGNPATTRLTSTAADANGNRPSMTLNL